MTITPLPITDRRVLHYWLYLCAQHGVKAECGHMTGHNKWHLKVTGPKAILKLIQARVFGYADALNGGAA